MKTIGPQILTPEDMTRMGAPLEEAEQLAAGQETFARPVGVARQMYNETRKALQTISQK